MSKINWRTKIALIIALIVGFSVGGFILGDQLGRQEGKRDAKIQEYAHHAAKEIESTCVDRGGEADIECIVDVVEANNNHERAEYDLVAQQNMARSALYMLFATLITTGVTALGVYYVRKTLIQANETNVAAAQAAVAANDTNQIMRNEQRPWIDIEISHAKIIENTTPQKTFSFVVELEMANRGVSPARVIAVRTYWPDEFEPSMAHFLEASKQRDAFRTTDDVKHALFIDGAKTVFGGGSITENFGTAATKSAHSIENDGPYGGIFPRVGIICQVVYTDASREIFRTDINFDLKGMWPKEDGSLPLVKSRIYSHYT